MDWIPNMIGFAYQAVGSFELRLLDLMAWNHESRLQGFECRGTLKAVSMWGGLFRDGPAATACVTPDPSSQAENERELRPNAPLVVPAQSNWILVCWFK